ncbi:MAG: hypothetical protein HY929_00270 [Euryarchaeota archaeon]|nr:hypothetical protein [Euryarchaeota archaeon]
MFEGLDILYPISLITIGSIILVLVLLVISLREPKKGEISPSCSPTGCSNHGLVVRSVENLATLSEQLEKEVKGLNLAHNLNSKNFSSEALAKIADLEIKLKSAEEEQNRVQALVYDLNEKFAKNLETFHEKTMELKEAQKSAELFTILHEIYDLLLAQTNLLSQIGDMGILGDINHLGKRLHQLKTKILDFENGKKAAIEISSKPNVAVEINAKH